MNRDRIAAIARGAGTVLAGSAILYSLARWLGWWTVALVIAGAAWERVRWTDGHGRFR